MGSIPSTITKQNKKEDLSSWYDNMCRYSQKLRQAQEFKPGQLGQYSETLSHQKKKKKKRRRRLGREGCSSEVECILSVLA
jgi:hypothetical protein